VACEAGRDGPDILTLHIRWLDFPRVQADIVGTLREVRDSWALSPTDSLAAQLLTPFGPVRRVHVPIRLVNEQLYGVGFATLPTSQLARAAAERLTGTLVPRFGMRIVVDVDPSPAGQRQTSLRNLLSSDRSHLCAYAFAPWT
jgi:hypothetical protein